MTEPAGTDTTVVHRPEHSRYELHVNGHLRGVADYLVAPDTGRVVFTHTEVDVPLRGKGYSEQLVTFALDDLRAAGGHGVARCWYVREFVDEHPEYADLFT